ncbi:hypothetical protein LMG26411_05402 [Cupriavidus numazuensis]|uniref:Uncharacterized protein n=1 Tax=Cupriavidus numazuensis TaxID=221992 RepID=A0ABM8TP71_9BURK|nr:hypothetical protein LMG26411_05402 [Cupriavidus numazuensis]
MDNRSTRRWLTNELLPRRLNLGRFIRGFDVTVKLGVIPGWGWHHFPALWDHHAFCISFMRRHRHLRQDSVREYACRDLRRRQTRAAGQDVPAPSAIAPGAPMPQR